MEKVYIPTLLGSKEYMQALFAEFENNDKLGVIMP